MEVISADLTIRDLKGRCPGSSIHQVKYALDQYDIQPRRRIGIIRLWSEEDVARVQSALKRIASRREVAGGTF
jgi:hypothetical protein